MIAMPTECWDALDEAGRPTGRQVARADTEDLSQPPLPGERHRPACVCLFDDERTLIQQRASDKHGWPDQWDVDAGGSVVAGETSQQGATRELREELGLDVDFTGQAPHPTIWGPHLLVDFHLVDAPGLDPATLRLQPAEVQDARWADLPQILAMLDAGVFLPLRRPLVELLFSLHRHPDGDI